MATRKSSRSPELVSLFDLKDVNAKASRLDSQKLGWLNQQYLKSDDPDEVAKHLEWHLRNAGYDLAQGPKPADIVIALRDRVQTLKDMAERAAVWFGPLTTYDDAAVAKHLTAGARAPLADARDRLAALAEWSADGVSQALHASAEALGIGMGKVAQPMRVAITGTQVSPDISHTVYLAGRDAGAGPHRRGPCKTACRGLIQGHGPPRFLHRPQAPRPRWRRLRARGRAVVRGAGAEPDADPRDRDALDRRCGPSVEGLRIAGSHEGDARRRRAADGVSRARLPASKTASCTSWRRSTRSSAATIRVAKRTRCRS